MKGVTIFFDLCIFLLPIPLLARVQMKARRKYALIGVFLLGLFTTVCSVMRMIQIIRISKDGNSTGLVLWGTIEMNVGVRLLPLPQYFHYIRSLFCVYTDVKVLPPSTDTTNLPPKSNTTGEKDREIDIAILLRLPHWRQRWLLLRWKIQGLLPPRENLRTPKRQRPCRWPRSSTQRKRGVDPSRNRRWEGHPSSPHRPGIPIAVAGQSRQRGRHRASRENGRGNHENDGSGHQSQQRERGFGDRRCADADAGKGESKPQPQR
jgi:hypothetical protein